jgi:hypothetical protein
MPKIFLPIVLLILLSIIFVPFLGKAAGNPTQGQPFVPCGNTGQAACTICDFFKMLITIYNFIVWDIATPLATIALIIGGIFMMISAGNPGLFGTGRTILLAAIIGLALVFGSYIIIDFILHTIGYSGSWASLNLSC